MCERQRVRDRERERKGERVRERGRVQSEVSGFLCGPGVDFDQNNTLKTRTWLTWTELKHTYTHTQTKHRHTHHKNAKHLHKLTACCVVATQAGVHSCDRLFLSFPLPSPTCRQALPFSFSVPKPHSPSWDNRWKASWEWTVSVTCWPDTGWRDSWGNGLLSADRGTKEDGNSIGCSKRLDFLLACRDQRLQTTWSFKL